MEDDPNDDRVVSWGREEFIPSNNTASTDYVTVKAVIKWNPDAKLIKSMGFFIDKSIPILGWFPADVKIDQDDIVVVDTFIDGLAEANERKLVVTDVKIYGVGTEVRRAVTLAPERMEM